MAEERDTPQARERQESGAPMPEPQGDAERRSPGGPAPDKPAGASSEEPPTPGRAPASAPSGDLRARPAYGGRGGPPGRGGFSSREFGPGRSRDRGGRFGRGEEAESPYEERVVRINRCATVVKGGRRFSFSAVVVVGDRKGMVGVGFGKANEVPPAVEKATKDAKKNLVKVSLAGTTVPHRISGKYRTSKVVLVPAVEGTGVIAGAAVRAVVECAGVKDVLTKVYGSTNGLNVVKAALAALKSLRSPEEVSRLRGVEVAR